MTGAPTSDLTRTTLQLLFIGVLIAGSFWILRPFLMPMSWAGMIVVSTWPLFLGLRARLGNRRGLAVAAMTLGLLLVLVVPLYLAISTIVENVERIAGWSSTLATLAVPQPPSWLQDIPLVGAKVAARWQEVAAEPPEIFAARVLPHARMALAWFATQVGSIGLMIVEFLLTVAIAVLLYANGDGVAQQLDRFARRLAGEEGARAINLAAQAARAVALGVVVTAFAQSVLGGIGLAIAGVPFAAVLTAVMFVSGIAQLGPSPVLIPAVIWIYARDGAAWGTGLLVWSLAVGVMDNFLRPVLIKRGANLPLLLIIAGVIGGLVAFGVIGLFLGPVLLAVVYTLFGAWVEQGEATTPEAQAPPLPPGS
jgi:predicted PurR-regulated permease PerM